MTNHFCWYSTEIFSIYSSHFGDHYSLAAFGLGSVSSLFLFSHLQQQAVFWLEMGSMHTSAF
jgi:hypothetical protein